MKVKVLVAQSCLTLRDPVDFSPPGSSVHEILQAGILEWVAISFSRGSSWPRDQTHLSCIACRSFTVWATREALQTVRYTKQFTPEWTAWPYLKDCIFTSIQAPSLVSGYSFLTSLFHLPAILLSSRAVYPTPSQQEHKPSFPCTYICSVCETGEECMNRPSGGPRPCQHLSRVLFPCGGHTAC